MYIMKGVNDMAGLSTVIELFGLARLAERCRCYETGSTSVPGCRSMLYLVMV